MRWRAAAPCSSKKTRAARSVAVRCVTREGWTLEDCTLAVFKRLKKRRLVASASGAPYRITYEGRVGVRAQPDNRA